jgi:hypothetical protein
MNEVQNIAEAIERFQSEPNCFTREILHRATSLEATDRDSAAVALRVAASWPGVASTCLELERIARSFTLAASECDLEGALEYRLRAAKLRLFITCAKVAEGREFDCLTSAHTVATLPKEHDQSIDRPPTAEPRQPE